MSPVCGRALGLGPPDTAPREDAESRYQWLLDVADLAALPTAVDGFLPDLAATICRVAEFDTTVPVLAWGRPESALLYHLARRPTREHAARFVLDSQRLNRRLQETALALGAAIELADVLAPPRSPILLRAARDGAVDRRPEVRQLQRAVHSERIQLRLKRGDAPDGISRSDYVGCRCEALAQTL